MAEFTGVEALGYATKQEAEEAARRWVAEESCDVIVRRADGIDQSYCDLGEEMQWVVERTEYPDHTSVHLTYSPDDGGWYASRHSHAFNPPNDLFTGIYQTKAEARTAARIGQWA